MDNAQKVYAGMTYGKGRLTESFINDDNRGDLFRVYQKFRPPLRRDDALRGSLEDGKAHGRLHVPDGLAEGGLAHKQIVCRLRNGACFLDLHSALK